MIIKSDLIETITSVSISLMAECHDMKEPEEASYHDGTALSFRFLQCTKLTNSV